MSNAPDNAESKILECQGCGEALRELDAREAQMVADNPMNFIFYCNSCRREPKNLIFPL